MTTNIQWTDETWLIWPGCAPSSPGCANCYAVHDGWRLSYNPNPKVSAPYAGIVVKVLGDGTRIHGGADHPRRREPGNLKFSGLTRFLPGRLADPLKWRKHRRVFVSANSDLFLPARVATEEGRRQIAAVFGVMAATPHTYQVLTKWPSVAREWFAWVAAQRHDEERRSGSWVCDHAGASVYCREAATEMLNANGWAIGNGLRRQPNWPLPNVWLGTSVEDRKRKDRIDELCQVPAALRFLSCEPLLEDLGDLDLGGIDWVIGGGESGTRARPCALEWLESIVDQCRAASVPAFVKQLGAYVVSEQRAAETVEEAVELLGEEARAAWPRSRWLWRAKLGHSKGGDMDDFPESLKVRMMPGDRWPPLPPQLGVFGG